MNYIRYNNAVNIFYQKMKEFVDCYKDQDRNIVIFGTSKIAGMMIEYLRHKKIMPCYIIDNAKAKQGKKAFGLDIFSPEILRRPFQNNVLVLITSSFQNDMIKQLREMGYSQTEHIVRIIDLPELMNNYNFVNRANMQKLTIQEIKNEMLRVVKYLKEVCEKNNLKYYLFGGSMLGAVRHKGFIPWDDDIDILMEIKDMKKFSELLKEDSEFSMVSFFDDSDYYDEVAVLYSNRYVVDSNHFPMQYSAGVGIDILPLFGVPNQMEKIDQYLEGYKELEMKKWSLLFNRVKCQEVANEIYQYFCKYDFYKSKYVASSSNHYTKTIAPQEYYLNYMLYSFEGIELPGPSNYDYILSKIYGDYMVLPPVEKQTGWHNYHAYKPKG